VAAKAEKSAEKLKARVGELEADLARAERKTKALQEVGLALGSTLDLDQLLELILKKITDLLDADRATLYLLDEQRKRLLSRIMIGDEARAIELPVGEGIAGHVAKVGRTVRVKDAYKDKRFNREWDVVTGYRTRSILAAPMKNHVGRTIGVIQVLNKRADEKTIERKSKRDPKRDSKRASSPPEVRYGEFSQDDEELLTALATQAAVSIDNSRLFLSVIQKNMQLVDTKEQLEHRVSDLKLLFELESAMGRAATIEDLARAVVVEAARACQARAGGLLVDEGEGGVWLYFVDLSSRPSARSAEDEASIEVKRVPVKRGEGVLGWAMAHNQAASVSPSVAHYGPPQIARQALPHALPPIGGTSATSPRPAVEAPTAASLVTATPRDVRQAGPHDARPSGPHDARPPGAHDARPSGAHDDHDLIPPVSRHRTVVAGVPITSAIAVPLEGTEDAAIGGIALYNSKKPLGFTQDDRSLLRLVSANATTALQLFRSRIEQEKSERLSAIGRLISGVMHDMRTPLTVISGYVQLMTNAKDEATRNEYQRVVLKQFDAISAMQREVLEFARGERSILLRKVYLTKFFGDLEAQLRQELASRAGDGSRSGQVVLVLELLDRSTARFDEAKITRVLHNLVRNAYEAMGEGGGTVTVRVLREGPDLVITVADTGRGIPEEIKGRLFQSFVTAGKRGGTGLGLAIVKKIVDEHQGTITVDSTDHGATFTIRLPQEDTSRPSTSPGADLGKSAS
jgi:signal transduction histidine kinase/putative methionine-R-sulfoxide reductase with GAF domain